MKNNIWKLIWDRFFEFFYAIIILLAMHQGTLWLKKIDKPDLSAYLTFFEIAFFMFSIGRLFRRN